MLQQTQVATVIPYYERFIRKFPTLQALAAADEQPVLRLWEGLGYYRRARQLHRAARRVCDAHGGEVPRDLEELRRLPGIGRYTASAIVSLAHDDRAPILEANTRRLYARLLGERGEVHTAAGEQRLIEFARQLLPRRQAGRFNQALMELGATVCLARSPRCTACPLADFCAARMQGLESSIPRPARRPRTEYVRQAVLVVRHQDRVLLLKRPDGERWAGLWDFARLPVEAQAAAQGNGALHRLAADLRRQTGVRAIITRKLATLKHSVTRFRISLDCYLAECPRGAQPPRLPANGRWVSPGQLEHYPLSTTARKLARMMVDTTSAP
jgi:A/G-specific adenine glycosylase